MQYGEDGVGRRKSGQIASRATSGHLGGRRFMAARRKKEVVATRHRQEKREATRLGNLLSQTGVQNFAKPHPVA